MLALVVAAALASPDAQASWLDLQVGGDTACVQPGGVKTQAQTLVGPDITPGPARVVVDARREGPQIRVTIELEAADRTETRSLVGSDCNVVTTAVALVIAVNVDPLAVATRVEPQALPLVRVPPPEQSPAARPSASPTERTRPPVPERNESGPRVSLVAVVGGEIGVLPRGGAAFEGTLGVVWPRARLLAGGLVLVGPNGRASEVDTVGGRFRLYSGLVRACGVPSRGRLEVPVCLGVEVGDLRAAGTGLTRGETVDALWVAPTAGVRPRWNALPRFSVGGALDLVVPVIRHRFATADAGSVHEVAPIAARLGLLVELRLP